MDVTDAPPYERPVSMVFQDLALFPHLTVYRNVLSFLGLANTFTGMMIGIVYEYLPLMPLPIYSSFERINRRLLEAAEALGARP